MRKRLSILGCLALALFTVRLWAGTAGVKPAAAAGDLPRFSLEVTFQGLIAYVPTDQGVWALLADADYDPNDPKEKIPFDFPVCLEKNKPLREQEYPRHVAALRFSGAKATLNGGALGELVPALMLRGRDLRFDTRKPGLPVQSFDTLADQKIMAKTLKGVPGAPSDFSAYAVVDPRYLTPDSAQAMQLPFLGARALVNFGDKIIAAPQICKGISPRFGFTTPENYIKGICAGDTLLAETVTVTQGDLIKPVTIRFPPSADELVLTPSTPGGTVKVEILNVMPKVIADRFFKFCDNTDEHFQAFQWYYRFLLNPPKPPPPDANCEQQFFPCLNDQNNAGGEKCPGMKLTPPPPPPPH